MRLRLSRPNIALIWLRIGAGRLHALHVVVLQAQLTNQKEYGIQIISLRASTLTIPFPWSIKLRFSYFHMFEFIFLVCIIPSMSQSMFMIDFQNICGQHPCHQYSNRVAPITIHFLTCILYQIFLFNCQLCYIPVYRNIMKRNKTRLPRTVPQPIGLFLFCIEFGWG